MRCRVWHDQGNAPHGKGKTGALWAPDAEAYLCDVHAMAGGHLTILFEPNTSGEIGIKVIAAETVEERTVAIK